MYLELHILMITLQLHYSNFSDKLKLRNPLSDVIPKSVTHKNKGSGNYTYLTVTLRQGFQMLHYSNFPN